MLLANLPWFEATLFRAMRRPGCFRVMVGNESEWRGEDGGAYEIFVLSTTTEGLAQTFNGLYSAPPSN